MKDKLPTKEDSEEGLTEKDMSEVTKNHKGDIAPTMEKEDWTLYQDIKEVTKNLNNNLP